MEIYETEDIITEQLIKCVQYYPALYSINSNSEYYNNKNNEVYWDDIQKKIGIQKSWLKVRWQKILTDYKRTIIYNHIHRKKVPPFKWANHLNYIQIDSNGMDDVTLDNDFMCKNNEKAFYITQQMLDECDISETVTQETVLKCKSNTEYEELMETIPEEQQKLNKSRKIERISEPKASYERCEDSIFGELVVAMLKKLEPEAKKRAKKEIMNVLL